MSFLTRPRFIGFKEHRSADTSEPAVLTQFSFVDGRRFEYPVCTLLMQYNSLLFSAFPPDWTLVPRNQVCTFMGSPVFTDVCRIHFL